GHVKLNGLADLMFRAIYRAPDKYALFINDGADGTPLLFASDRKMFIYDPIRPAILYCTDVGIGFTFRQEGDRLRLRWAGAQVEASNVLLDVKSVFGAPIGTDWVVKIADRKYRLTRTSERGNLLVASVDLAESCPFSKLEFIGQSDDNFLISIDKCTINKRIEDVQFAFPKKERLAEQIRVIDWSGDSSLKRHDEMAAIMRASYARAAATQPELGAVIPLPGFSEIDWERVKMND